MNYIEKLVNITNFNRGRPTLLTLTRRFYIVVSHICNEQDNVKTYRVIKLTWTHKWSSAQNDEVMGLFLITL